MSQTIAVTGAAGFIGSNLCRALLEKGYRVVAIDDLSAGTRENLPAGVEFHKVDICEPGLEKYLEGVSTIFHMAAKNCLPDCAADPVSTSRINVMGTSNVMMAAVAAKVPHVVYSDTSAEYEGVEDFPSPIDKVSPVSVYACSKRGGALAAQSIASLHGITFSTVRYFNVYGPAQDWRRVVPPVMSAFTIKLLNKEQPFIYGTGEKRRDFIHVDDVNSFHLMLIEKREIQGGTFNLGSGEDFSILEVFRVIQRELNSPIEPIFKPDLPAEAFRTCADVSRTVDTGWRPRISLEEGTRRFIEYTRERLAQA